MVCENLVVLHVIFYLMKILDTELFIISPRNGGMGDGRAGDWDARIGDGGVRNAIVCNMEEQEVFSLSLMIKTLHCIDFLD